MHSFKAMSEPEAPRVQAMHNETLSMLYRSIQIRIVAAALLLSLVACSQLGHTKPPSPDKNTPRAQLSIGYSLLYQEAAGIPKLKWIAIQTVSRHAYRRGTNV
jgi:hypothetical protein